MPGYLMANKRFYRALCRLRMSARRFSPPNSSIRSRQKKCEPVRSCVATRASATSRERSCHALAGKARCSGRATKARNDEESGVRTEISASTDSSGLVIVIMWKSSCSVGSLVVRSTEELVGHAWSPILSPGMGGDGTRLDQIEWQEIV